MPPSASSNLPFFWATAPVNEPFSCPKSSDSSSVSASAAQETATNGRSPRSPEKWMARATSSLPVPLSPWMSTVERWLATSRTRSKISAMRGLLLTRSWKRYWRVSFRRRIAFSRWRFFTRMIRSTRSEISCGWQGLTTYSCAPSFMAAIAVSTVA